MDLAELIRPQLELLPPTGALWVGYSGGLDSAVLLHLLAQQPELKPRLKAIHVHHGLSLNADAWLQHCQQQCELWQVPFQAEKVQLTNMKDGVEQAARTARYSAYKKYCQAGDSLLLAQHADDQLETFFMRLLRGAGLSGLTAMAAQRSLSKTEGNLTNNSTDNISLLRPLLGISRAQLEQYAQLEQLTWVEDESNQDSKFERNWWRNELLPIIWQKFPQRKNSVLRSIQQLQQDHLLLTELLQPKIDQACSAWNWPHCLPVALSLSELKNLPEHYWPYIMRGWLQKNGLMQPSQQWLSQLFSAVVNAQADAKSVLTIADWQVMRHKNFIFIVCLQACEELKVKEKAINLVVNQSYSWAGGIIRARKGSSISGENRLGLATGGYTLTTAKAVRGQKLTVKGRPSKTVKALLQEANIPAVLRENWPVLLHHQELVAIIGVAQAEHKLVDDGLVLYYTKS